MIDTLLQNIDRIKKPDFWNEYNLQPENYIVLTLHRPSNVDEESSLRNLLLGIDELANNKKVIFPVHPRTKAILENTNIKFKNIIYVEPQSYLSFMYLIKNSFAVITDSGGISEETTVLNIPCFTMRTTTERPETQTIGTNTLVGITIENLAKEFSSFLKNGKRKSGIPNLWDGKASERIIDILLRK